jgi:LacI family transcriptional regulator
MSDSKQALVVLTPGDFNTAAGLLKGLNQYLLTHPHLQAHFCMATSDSAATVHLVQRLVARFHPNGILAHVCWRRCDLRLEAVVPLVSIDDIRSSTYPTVMPDQKRAGRLAAEHLLEQGLEHYAFAAVFNRDNYATLRWRGFRDRLRQAGRTCHRFERSAQTLPGAPVSDDELCNWVTGLPKPVGVHAVHMALAVRLEWACAECGLNVPEEVAVVGGQESTDLATNVSPPVTTIDQNRSRLGYEALRLLDRLMHGAKTPIGPLLIPPVGIIKRQSSDVRGMRDPAVAALRRLIRERAHQPVVVKELLAQTHLARRVLERRFQKHLGHSLHDEIVLAHMERAQRLLQETLMPVTQVAALSGYVNYAVFSVAFHKHTGMTARAYRQQGAAAGGF